MLDEDTLSIDDERATEEIKQRMRRLFGRVGQNNTEAIREFHARRQNPVENVTLFSAHLTALCKKAYPFALNKEDFIIDQFIEGLINRQLKMELLLNRQNIDLQGAVNMARRYENAYLKINGSLNTRSRSQAELTQNNINQKVNTTTSNNNINRATSVTPNIGNYDQTRSQLNRQSQQSQTSSQNNNDVRFLRTRSELNSPNFYDSGKPNNQNCYYCNAADHVIRNCP